MGGPLPAAARAALTRWIERRQADAGHGSGAILLDSYGGAINRVGTQETACITDTSEYNLGEFCATGASTLGQTALAITGIIAFAYWVWNFGYRQGTTGSSIGKGIMKFKIVSEKTGQPIGFAMSFVRELVYLVAAAICGIVWLVAVLFPLWDQKRQTLVDKIFSTIALPI